MPKELGRGSQITKSIVCAAIGAIPGIIYFNIFGSGFGFVVLAFGIFIMVALSLPSVSTSRVLSQTAMTIVKYNVPLPENREEDATPNHSDKITDDAEGSPHVDDEASPLEVLRLLSIGGMIAALIFGWPYISDLYYGIVSQGWPTVDGSVTGVYPQPDMADKRDPKFIGRVDFEYQIDGVQFKSNQVSFNIPVSRSDSRLALDDVAQYQPKQKVNVFISPNDPGIAVLEPGLGSLELIFGSLGVLTTFLGLLSISYSVFRILVPKHRSRYSV